MRHENLGPFGPRHLLVFRFHCLLIGCLTRLLNLANFIQLLVPPLRSWPGIRFHSECAHYNCFAFVQLFCVSAFLQLQP